MCGIVGAVAHRNITPVLVEGLKRLNIVATILAASHYMWTDICNAHAAPPV